MGSLFDEVIRLALQANSLLSTTLISYILACMGVGVALGLFGKKLFYFMIALVGFCIAYVGCTLLEVDQSVSIVFGLVAAVLMIVLYKLSIFFFGAIFALFLAILFEVQEDHYILVALAGGILALLISDFILILISAFTGALLVTNATFSIFSLFSGNESGTVSSADFLPYLLDLAISYGDSEVVAQIAVAYIYEILALTILFIGFQLAFFKFGVFDKSDESSSANSPA